MPKWSRCFRYYWTHKKKAPRKSKGRDLGEWGGTPLVLPSPPCVYDVGPGAPAGTSPHLVVPLGSGREWGLRGPGASVWATEREPVFLEHLLVLRSCQEPGAQASES